MIYNGPSTLNGSLLHLKLWFSPAAELGSDGEQRLVDSRFSQLVTVTFPAFLQPLKATLTHGQQRQGHGQVTPLTLGPEESTKRKLE